MLLDLLDFLFRVFDYLKNVVGLTGVLGTLGFILGAINFYYLRRDKWPRLNIINAQGILYPFSYGDGITKESELRNEPAVIMRIQNSGEKEVHLRSVSLCIRNKRFRYQWSVMELADHTNQIYGPIRTIAHNNGKSVILRVPDTVTLRNGRAFVQFEDEVGNRYRSNTFSFRADKLKLTL